MSLSVMAIIDPRVSVSQKTQISNNNWIITTLLKLSIWRCSKITDLNQGAKVATMEWPKLQPG
jgi:hypothetical protein